MVRWQPRSWSPGAEGDDARRRSRAARGVIVRGAGKTLVRWVESGQMRTDRHRVVGDPSTEWYSSLTQGGLSNYWTSAVPRFAPEDFTDGAAHGERFAWPIGYDDLVPFYERAEEALVVTSGSALPNVPSNVRRYTARLPADWQDLCDRATSMGHGMARHADGQRSAVDGRATQHWVQQLPLRHQTAASCAHLSIDPISEGASDPMARERW